MEVALRSDAMGLGLSFAPCPYPLGLLSAQGPGPEAWVWLEEVRVESGADQAGMGCDWPQNTPLNLNLPLLPALTLPTGPLSLKRGNVI